MTLRLVRGLWGTVIQNTVSDTAYGWAYDVPSGVYRLTLDGPMGGRMLYCPTAEAAKSEFTDLVAHHSLPEGWTHTERKSLFVVRAAQLFFVVNLRQLLAIEYVLDNTLQMQIIYQACLGKQTMSKVELSTPDECRAIYETLSEQMELFIDATNRASQKEEIKA